MSDLISRSALLNTFNNTGIQITFDLPVEEILGEDVDIDDFTMLLQDAIQAYKKMVIDTIKNQPTAYDIDKVVEELCKEANETIVDFCSGCFVNVDRAVEIVKRGGVSNDACEWKLEDDNLMTGCGDYFNLYDNCTGKFKYCPRCGKKIKIVGD